MAIHDSKETIKLFEEIEKALQTISYGSIEIYIQDSKVTQITVRNIKKTSVDLLGKSPGNGDTEKSFKPKIHLKLRLDKR